MKNQEKISEQRFQLVYLVLCAIFLSNALLAEIVGVKIFSLDKALGITAPSLGSFQLSLNYTAGVIIWPIVFITTDLINEYYGKPGVKRISYITTACIAYAFFAIGIASSAPPADFWIEEGKKTAPGFDINLAFGSILGQSQSIIIGSLVAFLFGQLIDAYTFHWIKKTTGSRQIWLRATGSTLVSQLVDSFVVIFLAFYLLKDPTQRWPMRLVLEVALNNYIYKFIVAILLTPIIYLAHRWLNAYLGLNHR